MSRGPIEAPRKRPRVGCGSFGVTNRAPTLDAIENQQVAEETTLTFTATARDPDNDALTFSLDAGFPTGASMNSTSGVFPWTPTADQGRNTHDITVSVTGSGVKLFHTGNDLLGGRIGNDTLNGNGGNDTIWVAPERAAFWGVTGSTC